MSLLKDTAIVLRRLDYSETSQVLAVFTRDHGQARLIAKGIKRGTKTRVAVGLDLLELGHLLFSSNPAKADALGILAEWRQIESFPHLRIDLAKLYAAQYAAEVTSQLTEPNDPHPGVFNGLVDLLRALKVHPPLNALVRFLILLLHEIGLKPEWARCVNCGRSVAGDHVIYFSSRQGGAICRDCEPSMVEKRRVTAAVLAGLEGEVADAKIAPQAFDLLDYHLRETMGRPARLSEPLRIACGMMN